MGMLLPISICCTIALYMWIGAVMADAMVTGRMPSQKKSQGNLVLKRAGLTASEAINLLYDKLIEDQDASCLEAASDSPSQVDWNRAFAFVNGIPQPSESHLDGMSHAQIKTERLKARGLM